jgi:hypothetical protein
MLESGTSIRTSADTVVDLFLGRSAGVIRVNENTTLSLDKMNLTDTGADTVAEVQVNVPEGTMLFNTGGKLSAASRYEVKVPNGVAGIRGSSGRITSSSMIALRNGAMVYVHVPPGGNPTPYRLSAPPAVMFTPTDGVRVAPPELVRELDAQLRTLAITASPLPPVNPMANRGDFLSPAGPPQPAAGKPGYQWW